jgi:HSP20 family molecular chaperone IbpA
VRCATSSPEVPWASATARDHRARTTSRQLVLGDNLDLDRIEAHYDAGVLRLSVPVAERAKPRRIEVSSAPTDRTAIEA